MNLLCQGERSTFAKEIRMRQVLAERELAYSLAEMVMATPPYRPVRRT